MSKADTLSSKDAQYKAQAKQYLAEAQKILRELAIERRHGARRPLPKTNLIEQVKEILYGK